MYILPFVCTVYELGVHDWDSFLVCTASESVDVYTVSCAVKDYNRRISSYSKSCFYSNTPGESGSVAISLIRSRNTNNCPVFSASLLQNG